MALFFSSGIMADLVTCGIFGLCGGIALGFIFYMISTAFDLVRLLVS